MAPLAEELPLSALRPSNDGRALGFAWPDLCVGGFSDSSLLFVRAGIFTCSDATTRRNIFCFALCGVMLMLVIARGCFSDLL